MFGQPQVWGSPRFIISHAADLLLLALHLGGVICSTFRGRTSTGMQWCTRAAHGSHRHTCSPCQTLTSNRNDAAVSLRRLPAPDACGYELP